MALGTKVGSAQAAVVRGSTPFPHTKQIEQLANLRTNNLSAIRFEIHTRK